MKKDLLSSRSQVNVVGVALLLIMMVVNYGEEKGLCGLCYASDSSQFMFDTCGPRDIISLVIVGV
jgi:hypothetical protein